MTETNPVASVALLKPEMEEWSFERQLDVFLITFRDWLVQLARTED